MSGLDPDVLAAVRAAFVDPSPPVSSAVWDRIRPVWVPAYQATATTDPPTTCEEVPRAA